MIGLLIVMALTILICIVFMVTMLALNIKQERAFKEYMALTEGRFNYIDETERNVLDTLDAYPALLKDLIAQADEIHKSAEGILKLANEKADHSRKTIQAARMLHNQLHEKKEPFKYEEPEEDPDEPRS